MGARATSATVVYPGTRLKSARQWLSSWWCSVWGHQVDNHRFRLESPAAGCRECPCGASYLAEDGSFTHVRHTLTCFFGHHTYTKVVDRDGHREYACVDCGHPLLFHADHDPYAESAIFNKKVRYLCGLFGHRVHAVADRDGFREFACHCGHSFLKPEGDRKAAHHASGHLRVERASHPLRDAAGWLCGVRLSRLRPSVLLRRCRDQG